MKALYVMVLIFMSSCATEQTNAFLWGFSQGAGYAQDYREIQRESEFRFRPIQTPETVKCTSFEIGRETYTTCK